MANDHVNISGDHMDSARKFLSVELKGLSPSDLTNWVLDNWTDQQVRDYLVVVWDRNEP